jgi:starch phosphorylase
MLQEYVERAYLPGAASYQRRAAEGAAGARALERWARHLEQHWSAIRFGEVTESASNGRLSIAVPVWLGAINPDDVGVELYANAEDTPAPAVAPMTPGEAVAGDTGAVVYRLTFETSRPGWHFTPRVVPFHPEARVPIEVPLVAWQR